MNLGSVFGVPSTWTWQKLLFIFICQRIHEKLFWLCITCLYFNQFQSICEDCFKFELNEIRQIRRRSIAGSCRSIADISAKKNNFIAHPSRVTPIDRGLGTSFIAETQIHRRSFAGPWANVRLNTWTWMQCSCRSFAESGRPIDNFSNLICRVLYKLYCLFMFWLKEREPRDYKLKFSVFWAN